eukprot:SAG11_NODE_3489_length_2416_cov_2.003884_1_plen_512_part_10
MKRLARGVFTHCTRTTVPTVLVTQCQTAAELHGEVEEGTFWRVIAKATVRTGSETTSSRAGHLLPGDVIKTLEVVATDSGLLRVRFSSTSRGGVKGWTSATSSQGLQLLQKLEPTEVPADAQGGADSGEGGPDTIDGGYGASTAEDDGCGQYVCIKRSVLRSEFESKSKKCGALDPGEAVVVVEARCNQDGVLRVHVEGRGWCSTEGNDGSTLLKFVGAAEGSRLDSGGGGGGDFCADDVDDDEIDTDDANTGEYRALKAAVVRTTPDVDSEMLQRLEIGAIVNVTRSQVWEPTAQLRVRLQGGGWTSITAGDGSALLARAEPVVDDAYARASAAAAARSAAAAAARLEEGAEETNMETLLDLLLNQELSAKFGMMEATADDGRKLKVDAVAFHCTRPEAAELLTKKRAQMLAEPEPAPARSTEFAMATGQVTSEWSVRLLEVKVEEREEDDKIALAKANLDKAGMSTEHHGALYVLEVSDGVGNHWQIEKRFSAFHELDSKLRKTGVPANQ